MNIWWSDRSFEDLLGRLQDPDKVAVILTSFDLTEMSDDLSAVGDVPAFVALKSVPRAMSEGEWWARYRHFFEKRRPPVKELSFVGDHQPG